MSKSLPGCVTVRQHVTIGAKRRVHEISVILLAAACESTITSK